MKCPKTHPDVVCQLCGLHYYPSKCETACNNHFKRWLEKEPEVQRLHKQWLQSEAESEEV